jgi:predicted ATP-binding protein involved in virulence
MQIDEIRLENFRCFAEKQFVFAPQFNVLIGDNGVGKTAVLDALAVGISTVLLRIDGQSARSIHPNDVRQITNLGRDIPTNEFMFPVRIQCKGKIDNREIEWERSLLGSDRRTTQRDARELTAFAKHLQEQVRRQEDVPLPLIAYYDTGRLWFHADGKSRLTVVIRHTQPVARSNGSADTVKPGSRLDGYSKCLSPDNNQEFLHRWFRTQELSALQRETVNPTLEGVRTAISRGMERWQRVYYDIQLDDICAEDHNRNRMPIRLLSAGQRNVLYMIFDLAYRAATLNPQFGADAARKTAGVVLIDEIDLHLHPKWQRRVVDDLRRVFPNIQFITTTHSPIVVQSLRQGELIDLNDDDPGDYVNRSPEDILENVMDVPLPQRGERSQQMIRVAEEYYNLLATADTAKNGRLDELRQRLDELLEPYADNEAYVALLRQKRAAAGIDGD